MSRQVLAERVSAPFTGVKVTGTPDAPVIENVLLCGPVSRNRKRYLKEAFAGDRVKRYNGKPVKVTKKHGEANSLYEEQIGTVENARHRHDGMPIGDLVINPATEIARKFIWDAKNKPTACGMSHVAECDLRRASDGWDEVTELVEAISVDVIGAGHAATVTSLAEGAHMKTTLRAVIENCRPRLSEAKKALARKLLLVAEDDAGMGAMMDAPVDASAEGTDPDQAITDAFKQAMHAQIDALLEGSHTLAELITKIRELGKAHGKLMGKGDAEPEPDASETVPESKLPTWDDVVAECEAAKLTDAPAKLAARLVKIADKDTRTFVIETTKKATEARGETPVSTPRNRPPANPEQKNGKPARVTLD